MAELTYNEKRLVLSAANRIREGLMQLHKFHCQNETAYEELISKLLDNEQVSWREVMNYADAVAEFSDGE